MSYNIERFKEFIRAIKNDDIYFIMNEVSYIRKTDCIDKFNECKKQCFEKK